MCQDVVFYKTLNHTPYALHDLRGRDAVQLCPSPPRPPPSPSPLSLRVCTDVGRRRSDSDAARVLGDALWSQVGSPPKRHCTSPPRRLPFPFRPLASSLPLSLSLTPSPFFVLPLARESAVSAIPAFCCSVPFVALQYLPSVDASPHAFVQSANTPLLPRVRILP